MKKVNKGFTLIELLVVIGIIAILAAIVIVSINPAKRFQDAQNSQRQANVESILNALQQYTVDNKGTLCAEVTTTLEYIKSDEADIAECLAAYLAILPVDPDTGTWTDDDSYNTGYRIQKNASNQITVSAPSAEGGVTISITR